ncbi:MAG: alpha/beta hydrolase [Acidimicrobiia bacterium]
MSFVFLSISLAAFALGLAATRGRGIRGPWWGPAMAAAELAPWFLAATGVVVLFFYAAGWTGGWAGTLGLILTALGAAGFLLALFRSLRGRASIIAGVAEVLGGEPSLPRTRWRSLLRPFPPLESRLRLDTHSYGPHERHLVDRVTAPTFTGPAPVLIHIHGGGWWRGRKSQQGRPLLRHMARSGWVVLAATYRLSPEATFPDHLHDIERLIAWAKANAAELGIDSRFVAITGGSAGGHLAALAGLGNGDARVQVAVPFYGVHDMFAADGVSAKWPYLVTQIMKSDPVTDREAWLAASPVHRATADRAPFLVVHGGADSLVDAEESRLLAQRLREAGGPPVGYIEVPWGHHGFDFFASIRALRLAAAVGAVLDRLYERHQQRLVEND